jgi:hypothetical protein
MKTKLWAIYYYHRLHIFSFVRNTNDGRCPSRTHKATRKRQNLINSALLTTDTRARLGPHLGDITIIIKKNL